MLNKRSDSMFWNTISLFALYLPFALLAGGGGIFPGVIVAIVWIVIFAVIAIPVHFLSIQANPILLWLLSYLFMVFLLNLAIKWVGKKRGLYRSY